MFFLENINLKNHLLLFWEHKMLS